nr:odorant binding protein [Semanotus bifasciatus]
MTFFLVLVYVLSIWTPTAPAASTTTISKGPFKVFIKNCQEESGATKADMEIIKMKKLPETKTGRCFLQCLFNKAKIMDDGKFNKQGMVMAFVPSTKGDASKIKQLKELGDVCEKEIGGKRPDNCEGVRLVVECVARHGKAYGITFSNSKNTV